MYMCIYIYIYIYMKGREPLQDDGLRLHAGADAPGRPEGRPGRDKWGRHEWGRCNFLCFLTEGLFGYSREPAFIFTKMLGRTFFFWSFCYKEINTFAAAPLVLTPFCPQPNHTYASKWPCFIGSAHTTR